MWLHYEDGSLSDKTDSYILQGCYFHLRNYLRKVQDKVHILSINTGIGDDGTKLEDILTIDGITTFDYLESKIDIEAREEKYLTEREKKNLSFIMEGMSMREIGAKLGISHVMVLKIRNKIKEKYLQLNNEALD